MIILQQEEIEIEISNSAKPTAVSNVAYPLNDLDDRIFEILTYSIFKKRISVGDKSLVKRFDDVVLMQGVGEKGIDCYLKKGSKIVAVIQCKKYAKNLSDTLILNELIKFCLHVIIDKTKFELNKKFTYYIATSTGFTGKASLLFTVIKNNNAYRTYGFEKLVREVINRYKEFEHLQYQIVLPQILKLINGFEYELIGPNDYNLWINDFKEIITTFFEVRKVTDNKLLEDKTKEIISRIGQIGSDKINIDKFLNAYSKIAIDKLNVVNFIGFDIQRHRQRPDDITLTDLFVQPSFRQRIFEKNDKVNSIIEGELKITNLFKSEKNIVILGDPGAGKSLLVKYLIVSILQNQAEKLGVKQFTDHFPIRIELRKYIEKGDNKSITEYISEHLTNEYQLNITHREVEDIFETYPTLLFFDGLDEIFNINHKTKVKEAIESFSTRFFLSKCVVTSRFIGYHDIRFNPKKFDEFAIIRFDQTQIKELVTKFYDTQHTSSEKKRLAIESCLKQIDKDVDRELKSNPLILTLILILASNNIIIPDSKLEIYESCTRTLVDSLDTNAKGLKIEMPVSNKNFTFCHLANWQYVSQSNSDEITYVKAKNEIAHFLITREECTDFKDAEIKAEKFLDYAERRSIYFENNFTHKTFLEYFTAEYLYSKCIAKASDYGRKKLLETVTEFLPSSFWYIVFELLFTRIDNFQPDNELLDEIFTSQLNSNALEVFYFLISNLGRFKNVGKGVKKRIIHKAILLCIKGEKLKKELKRSSAFEENNIIEKFHNLLNDPSLRTLLQQVITELENDKLSERQLIELYNLYFEINRSKHSASQNLTKLVIDIPKQLNELSNRDLLLYSHVNFDKYSRNSRISIDVLLNQIENFGHKSLFNHIPLRYSEYSQRVDTFDVYLMNTIEMSDAESFKSDLNKLMEYGLKFNAIMDHIKSNNLFYYIRSENFEKILRLYLKSSEPKIDEILLALINRGGNKMKVAYSKFRNSNSHPKLKIVDKLFEAKQRQLNIKTSRITR